MFLVEANKRNITLIQRECPFYPNFQTNFTAAAKLVRAQTIAFEDFIAFKGEQGAKDAGKMRAEGKEYVVKDGDVMNFLFSS